MLNILAERALATAAGGMSRAEEFEQLMRKHQGSVYNAALRMTGNPEDAKDLAQDAFVRAYRSFDSYKKDTAFDKWLYRIVTNLFIDEVRKRKRRPETESYDAPVRTEEGSMQRELPDHGADPFIVLDKNAMDSRVSAALQALQPEFRMVVILCDIEGFSYEEIAGIMNTSIGTVRSRLHRARKALREALASHFDAQRRIN